MIIDDRLNFKDQVKSIGEMAYIGALARIIPNIEGPIPFKGG